MKKTVRTLVYVLAGIVGLLLLVIVGFTLLFDVNQYKPQIEAAVSRSTGMDLDLKGPAHLDFFPRLQVSAENVHLSNRGTQVFSAEEVETSVAILPYLLHRELVVEQVTLVRPTIQVEKLANGKMNYEPTQSRPEKEPKNRQKSQAGEQGKPVQPGQVHAIQVKEGKMTYLDRKSKEKVEVKGLDAKISNLEWGSGSSQSPQKDLLKTVTFEGNVSAQNLTAQSMNISNLKTHLEGKGGVFRLNPTEAQVWGGTVTGNAQVDLSGKTPRINLEQNATHLDLKEANARGKNQVAGTIDGSLRISASGKDTDAILRSSQGTVSVRSQDLTLTGVNIDQLADRLKNLKSMDLAQIGTSLLPGPIGSILRGETPSAAPAAPNVPQSKKTVINHLVSTWNIRNGIASAQDVAFSTGKTTVAFQGKLNLVNQTYQDFHIASIDEKGCAKNQLEVAGPLKKPRPVVSAKDVAEIPSGETGQTLGSIGSQVAGIFGGKQEPSQDKPPTQQENPPTECKAFYHGSLVSP